MLAFAQPDPLGPVVSLMPTLRIRHLTPCALAWIALIAFLGLTARADASVPLKPPGKQVFFGVTDNGETEGYRSFAKAVGKRPAVIQTFHPWGNTLSQALPRWRTVRARPMLHITTKADDGTELITPRQIALGRGDDYLLRLNLVLARQNTPTYIRPMGEPNRCLNPYAGVAGSTGSWALSICRKSGSEHAARSPSSSGPLPFRWSGARCPPVRRSPDPTTPPATGRGVSGSTGWPPTSTPDTETGTTSSASTRNGQQGRNCPWP